MLDNEKKQLIRDLLLKGDVTYQSISQYAKVSFTTIANVRKELVSEGLMEPSRNTGRKPKLDLTDDEIRYLRNDYHSNKPVQEVMATYGFQTKPTFYRALRVLGIPLKQKILGKHQRNYDGAVQDYVMSSKTVEEICAEHDISKPTLFDQIRKRGLTFRMEKFQIRSDAVLDRKLYDILDEYDIKPLAENQSEELAEKNQSESESESELDLEENQGDLL